MEGTSFGGKNKSLYQCDDDKCLNIQTLTDQEITPENSYQGKAERKLTEMKVKMQNMEKLNTADIAFFNAIGNTFPIYDYLSFEAISGEHLIDKSSELVASYMLLQYVNKIIHEVRQSLHVLEAKQINDQHVKDFFNTIGSSAKCHE